MASTSKRRVVSNMLTMGSGQIVTWLVSTIYLVLISRRLGPALQGELSRAGYAVLLFGLLMSLGMEGYVTRSVARTPERAHMLVSAAIVVRLALMLPVLAALYLYLSVAHIDSESRIISFILFAGMIIGALGSPLSAAFVGREQMGLGTAGAVIQNVLELALVGIVLLLHGGVLFFAATNVLMALSLLILNLYWMRGSIRLSLHVPRSVLREVITGGLGFWVGTVLYNVYLYIDAIILGYFAGDRGVGVYAPATRLFAVPLFLPGIISVATGPLLSRLGLGVQHDFAHVSRKTLALLILCAVPLAIGTATFASSLIISVFGHKYAESAPVLVVLSLCIPTTYLSIQFYQMVVARDQQWRWNIINIVGCIVNPLLNLLLIPYAIKHWHNGALGAAWSLAGTEAMMASYGAVVLRDVVFHREMARIVGIALAAGAAQGAVLFVTAAWWPPMGEALGLITYAIVILSLGALPREDITLLWQIGAGRVRGLYAKARPRPRVGAAPPESLHG